MSSQEAGRLVGHDIVDRLHVIKAKCGRALNCALADRVDIDGAIAEIESLRSSHEAMLEGCEIIIELKQENERLRTALRAVRACTDPAWQAQLIKDAFREDEP